MRNLSSTHHTGSHGSSNSDGEDVGGTAGIGVLSSGESLGAMAGAARRRRTSQAPGQQAFPKATSTSDVERRSPQHYLEEYNQNYGNHTTASSSSMEVRGHHHHKNNKDVSAGAAPHSTGGLGERYSTTASEVYYAQYHNHSPHHHQQQHPYQHHYDNPQHHHPQAGMMMMSLHRTHSTPNAHKLSFHHFERTFGLDPNPLAAVHFRKALHVPDSQYRQFLQESSGRKPPSVINPICCANLCAGFSCVGLIFMVFIGILLDTQPLFIAGTLPSALKENDNGKSSTIYFVTAERLPAATHAYQASYAYAVTMVVCLIYVYYERLQSMVRRRSYQDVPDATSLTTTTPGSSASTVGVVGDSTTDYHPHHHHHHHHQGYQMSMWNRLVATSSVKLRELWNHRGSADYKKRKTRKNCAKTI